MATAAVSSVWSKEAVRELSDSELAALLNDENAQDAARELAKAETERRDREYGEAQVERAPQDEVEIDGTVELGQMELFQLGGKAPTRASVKFTGGKVSIVRGQAFRKGDRIRFSGEAMVNLVAQKDEHDPKTGVVVDCEQRHEARIINLRLDSAD